MHQGDPKLNFESKTKETTMMHKLDSFIVVLGLANLIMGALNLAWFYSDVPVRILGMANLVVGVWLLLVIIL